MIRPNMLAAAARKKSHSSPSKSNSDIGRLSAPLTTRVGGVLPLLCSARPHQLQDLVPDGRRQAAPACDQLAERLVLPAHFRPAQEMFSITTSSASVCVRMIAGRTEK